MEGLRSSISFVMHWEAEKQVVGAEVGVLSGVHAVEMLLRMPFLKCLYLIDPYEETYGPHKDVAEKSVFSFRERKRWINKEFKDCTPQDIDEVLDFVYIDGDHSYESVKVDIEQAVRFTKLHGVICGHDFQMEDVRLAVEEYCKNHNRLLRTWGGEWWFINGEL